jgi:L-threonylcarbamoyladenylate synthase
MQLEVTPENLEAVAGKAREIMRGGGIVVYPTDTTYGLGADATNKRAVEAVYQAKSRPLGKPLSVAVPSLEAVEDLAVVGSSLRGVLSRILPGPYTLILDTKAQIPHITPGGRVGVRVPAHAVPARLSQDFPVTCTSANLSGRPSPRSVAEVTVASDLVLEAGPSLSGDSTIVDFSSDPPRILRKGSANLAVLRKALARSGMQLPLTCQE